MKSMARESPLFDEDVFTIWAGLDHNTRSRPNKSSLLELVTKFTCNVVIIIIYVSNTDNHKHNLKYDEIQTEDLTPPSR